MLYLINIYKKYLQCEKGINFLFIFGWYFIQLDYVH